MTPTANRFAAPPQLTPHGADVVVSLLSRLWLLKRRLWKWDDEWAPFLVLSIGSVEVSDLAHLAVLGGWLSGMAQMELARRSGELECWGISDYDAARNTVMFQFQRATQ